MPHLPNIIVLLLDTARAQNFSCYGYERSTSPCIDAIAREGVLYENAIATGCWSLPSQVSLLTGMFPIKHGAHELHLSYDQQYPLLPEVLKHEGYHTLGVSPNSWMSDEFGVTRGFDTYLKLWQYWHTMPAFDDGTPALVSALTRKINRLYGRYIFPRCNSARHVMQHIRSLLATAPEPFFLYAIYWDTHLPYQVHGKHKTRWLPAGMTYRRARRVNRSHLRYFAGQVTMTDEDFDILRACYDEALASLDQEIGVFVEELRQQGVLDRTLLIITSDHGENIGEHGLMSHAYSLHDTLIRVPLIIRYPKRFPAGERVTRQVQLTDVFPTVLDVLQLHVPHVRQELQGISLLTPEPPASGAHPAYAEMLAPHPSMQTVNRRAGLPEDTPRPTYDRALRCLRTADHKLIWASNGQHALYDLHEDPAETKNRFTDDPDLSARLLEALRKQQPLGGSLPTETGPDFDDDLHQRLRDLGYID